MFFSFFFNVQTPITSCPLMSSPNRIFINRLKIFTPRHIFLSGKIPPPKQKGEENEFRHYPYVYKIYKRGYGKSNAIFGFIKRVCIMPCVTQSPKSNFQNPTLFFSPSIITRFMYFWNEWQLRGTIIVLVSHGYPRIRNGKILETFFW